MKSLPAKHNRGQGLIELLIALAIFGIIVMPAVSSMINLLDSQIKNRRRIEASQFNRSGLEIVYNLAANDWDNFSTIIPGETYKIVTAPSLSLETGANFSGIFKREVSFQIGRRDADGNPTDDPLAEEDPNLLRATCSVYWQHRGREQTMTATTYLINFQPI